MKTYHVIQRWRGNPKAKREIEVYASSGVEARKIADEDPNWYSVRAESHEEWTARMEEETWSR